MSKHPVNQSRPLVRKVWHELKRKHLEKSYSVQVSIEFYCIGDRGNDGEKGDAGFKGDAGELGEKGTTGDIGFTGEKGLPGQPGERVSFRGFFISVEENRDACLSESNQNLRKSSQFCSGNAQFR